jgi:L-rhamnose isomerase/sugar isomerase
MSETWNARTAPDLTAVKDALKNHQVELPSWAFGNSGTRFKVFGQPGVPRTPFEKADDAGQVHRYTGVAPVMAVHIPWDKVDDYDALAAHAKACGIRIGTVNANVFQDDDYKLGSVCNPDPEVRRQALAHLLECVDIMDVTGSRDLKLWFADGTNYPGQDDIAARQDRLAEALAAVYQRLGPGQRMLLEYKLFEPAFYSTDVPDWGTALAHCTALGQRAQVVVDTGHHAPGVNIEFIVALLLKAGKLGGFDFNSRFYADDDLMVGAADPFQLFRIMHEVVKAGALAPAAGVAFMLDQCHNIEPKIPAQIRSVMNVQEAVAKALLVDAAALRAAQLAGDVLAANAALMDAYATDVRPLLAGSGRIWDSTRTRSGPTSLPGTRRRSSPSGSAAPPPAGEREPDERLAAWPPDGEPEPAGGACPRSSPSQADCRLRAMPWAATCSAATSLTRDRRRSATTKPSAPTTPSPVTIGTPTERAPEVISSSVVAYPSARTRSSWLASRAGDVIVRGRKRGNGPARTRWRTSSGAWASSTLPTPVACIGSREPTVLTTGTERVPESVSRYRTWSSSRTARCTVSSVAPYRSCRNGIATSRSSRATGASSPMSHKRLPTT